VAAGGTSSQQLVIRHEPLGHVDLPLPGVGLRERQAAEEHDGGGQRSDGRDGVA